MTSFTVLIDVLTDETFIKYFKPTCDAVENLFSINSENFEKSFNDFLNFCKQNNPIPYEWIVNLILYFISIRLKNASIYCKQFFEKLNLNFPTIFNQTFLKQMFKNSDNSKDILDLYDRVIFNPTKPDEFNKFFIQQKQDSLEYIIVNDDIEGFQERLKKEESFNYDQEINLKDYFFAYLYPTKLSLLDFAALNGSIKIFKFLLMNNQNLSDNTCEMAVAGGNQEIIKLLEEKNQNLADCLITSIKFNRYEITDYILSHYTCQTIPISLCISSFNIRAIYFYLANKESLTIESETNVPFYEESKHLSPISMKLFELLDQQGLFSNEMNGESQTAFYNVCLQSNVTKEIIQIFLDHKVDINKGYKNNESNREFILTPLYAICSQPIQHGDLIKLLIENGADVNLGSKTPLSALIAQENVNYVMIEYLLEKGANINKGLESPLFIACCKNDFTLIKYLIEKGANPNTGNSQKTPLYQLFTGNNVNYDIIRYLIQHKANINAGSLLPDKTTCFDLIFTKEGVPLDLVENALGRQRLNREQNLEVYLKSHKNIQFRELFKIFSKNCSGSIKDNISKMFINKILEVQGYDFNFLQEFVDMKNIDQVLTLLSIAKKHNENDYSLLIQVLKRKNLLFSELESLFEKAIEEDDSDKAIAIGEISGTKVNELLTQESFSSAISNKNLPLVQYFCEKGFDIFGIDYCESCFYGLKEENPEIYQYLLSRCPYVPDNFEPSTVDAIESNNIESVKLFIENTKNKEEWLTKIFNYCLEVELTVPPEMADFLNSYGIKLDPDEIWAQVGNDRNNAYQKILNLLPYIRTDPAYYKLLKTLDPKYIKRMHKQNLAYKDDLGRNQLHIKCMKGKFEKVQELCEKGIDIHAVTEYGWTPLHYACYYGYEDIIRYLLDKGADKDLTVKDIDGNTPLALLDILEIEQRQLREEISTKYSIPSEIYTRHPLESKYDPSKDIYEGISFEVYKEKELPYIESYLLFESDVNEVEDEYDLPPLVNAINESPRSKFRTLLVAKCLIIAGADVNYFNNDFNYYPLNLAVQSHNFELLKYLIQNDAYPDPDSECEIPLHESAMRGYCDFINYLLEHDASIDYTGIRYAFGTALHVACENDQLEAVRTLCEKGADINYTDHFGRTPLAISENPEIINYLKSKGATK